MKEVFENGYTPAKKDRLKQILERQSKAETFKSWLDSTISMIRLKSREDSDLVLCLKLTESLKEKYNSFKTVIELPEEQGKSSFFINEKQDYLEIITYQNKKPVKTEVKKSDLIFFEDIIKKIFRVKDKRIKFDDSDYIESKFIALRWAKEIKNEPMNWKDFFSNRKYHNYFTICMRVLREKGIIDYTGGRIRCNI